MSNIDKHYHNILEHFPLHPFFTTDGAIIYCDVLYNFAGHDTPPDGNSMIRISFYKSKAIYGVQAYVSSQVHECQPIAIWS